MTDSPTPVPPPLPPAVESDARVVVYSTRNDAFTPAWELRLEGGRLQVRTEAEQQRTLALRDAVELRLEFAPTRVEPERYRCRLRLRGGTMISFFNRRYEGLATFGDTSAAYRHFVGELIAAVACHAPECRLVAGAGAGNYVLGVAGFAVAVVLVAGATVWSLLVGLWWLVVVKILVLLFSFPSAASWLARNRQRLFRPEQVPAGVMPTADRS